MTSDPTSRRARPRARRLTPALAAGAPHAGGGGRAARRVRHAPALAELRAPPVAVWAGEVVLLVDAVPGDALAAACALQALGRGRVRVAQLRSALSPGACAGVLAAGTCFGRAVVCVVTAAPGAGAAVETLRRAVARLAPCRCVWLRPGEARTRAPAARLLTVSGPQ